MEDSKTMNMHVSEGRRPRVQSHVGGARPPFECIALLLQGGGALGAYQAGVYQALAEADLHPDWVAGISIGAINAALIAGNPPETRVDQLRRFWNAVTADPGLWGDVSGGFYAPRGDLARGLVNQLSAAWAAAFGVRGFFSPRGLPPWLQPAGTLDATSYYDTAALKTTLERFVDFDRINAGGTRFSVGAVNVTTGNFVYFDNTTHAIRPEHVMASGALPPGFPPIEIEGELYWDGGLVSNTPLQWMAESELRQDTLAFQVDLWNARGAVPRTLAEVATRQKEIQYSSRTRANSDSFRHRQNLRHALSKLLSKLPDDLKDTPEYQLLHEGGDRKVYNLIQLIYRSRTYEGGSKDYEFSTQSMEEHWSAGYFDTVRALRHPQVLERPRNSEGLYIFDFAVNGRE
jgi:NTE family protein